MATKKKKKKRYRHILHMPFSDNIPESLNQSSLNIKKKNFYKMRKENVNQYSNPDKNISLKHKNEVE